VFLSLVVAVYTAAVRLPAKAATAAGGIALAGIVANSIVRFAGAYGAEAIAGLLPLAGWVIVPFAVGRGVRVGRESQARDRAEELRRHAYEERLRIAQEVHDVVGHGLAAINMQAEIALHVLPKRPEHAETALEAISRTSKQALDELRATLTVLRRDGDTRLGLARLDEIVARVEGAGVPVTVTVRGARRSLPDDVDLAGYRIVQEALTNVIRHAGTAPATVRVEYQPQTVTIEVTDQGNAEPAPSDGHGIAGMRERVAALGGQFEAGPRDGQGFRVYACLPTT
jgi:signal transduction histidine kinase